VVSRNRGRSWNVLHVNTGALLYLNVGKQVPTSQKDEYLAVVLASYCLHNLQSNDTGPSKNFLVSPQDTVDWNTDNLIAFSFLNLELSPILMSVFTENTRKFTGDNPSLSRLSRRQNSIKCSRARRLVRSL
jgi:hypothetical protein